MHRLDARAVQYYRENGYTLFHQPVFSAPQFTRLSALFEQLLAARGGKRMDELDTPHFACPELLDFLMDDAVLDLVEPILGPDFGLWSSHFICKEPRIGRATPWHEDSSYWNGRFDRFDGIVTVWLAIDKVDAANGAMKVIPSTHHNGFSEYEQVGKENNLFATRAKGVDEAKAVTFDLAPNECSLHDSRIIHGADANTSDRRRAGYTMRYFSQHLRLNRDNPANQGFKIWHCRGANPHGNPVVNP